MVSVLGSMEDGPKNKKIVFDDDGEVVAKDDTKRKNKKKSKSGSDMGVKTEENSFENFANSKGETNEDAESSKKWYQVVCNCKSSLFFYERLD